MFEYDPFRFHLKVADQWVKMKDEEKKQHDRQLLTDDLKKVFQKRRLRMDSRMDAVDHSDGGFMFMLILF